MLVEEGFWLQVRTLNCGNFTRFLIMGNAAFMSSTVVLKEQLPRGSGVLIVKGWRPCCEA